MLLETWPIDRFVFYARNPRKNDPAIDRMCASIREFGFKCPVLARSDGTVVDGHLRLKSAKKLGITEIRLSSLTNQCDAGKGKPAQGEVHRCVGEGELELGGARAPITRTKGISTRPGLAGFWRERRLPIRCRSQDRGPLPP